MVCKIFNRSGIVTAQEEQVLNLQHQGLPIQSELNVPVKYIGVGEGIDDLQKFDSDEFVNALFNVEA